MWILFSILAALFWATCNTIDKFVLTKLVKHPFVPLIIFGIISLVTGIIVWLAKGIAPFSLWNMAVALMVGITYALMTVLYFRALQLEEVSRVVPLFYLSPLFILVFSVPLFHEKLVVLNYLGIILLVIGAILISVKKLEFRISKAVGLMLLSALFMAVDQLLSKYLLITNDFWTVFFYIRIGTFIAVTPIIIAYFSELKKNHKEVGPKLILATSLSESLNVLGVIFITLAIAVGSVALSNALASIQPFFLLLITVLISLFYPKILKEEIDKKTVFYKLIAIILMFLGVILIM